MYIFIYLNIGLREVKSGSREILAVLSDDMIYIIDPINGLLSNTVVNNCTDFDWSPVEREENKVLISVYIYMCRYKYVDVYIYTYVYIWI
jgi:hypothetical protein